MSISEENFRRFLGRGLHGDLVGAMYRYVVHGINPGGGISAVLGNDLFQASQSLHPAIRAELSSFAQWVITCMPHGSYGSREIIQNWSNDCDGIRSQYIEQASAEIAECVLRGIVPKHDPMYGHLLLD